MADCSTPSLFKSHAKGKPLTGMTKQIVLNVYSKLRKKHPGESINKICELTSELTGVSARSVISAKKEAKGSGGVLRTPEKKRPRAAGLRTRLRKYDEFTLNAVRRKVHQFYARNEIPTAKKIQLAINTDEDLPDFSVSTVRRILNDVGFSFKKRKRNSLLIERDDIIVWRRKYLRSIRSFRRQGRKIYWTDETWCNAGQTNSKVWQDTTIKSARQAFLEGLTTGLKAPSGKGGRLIIVHAGSETGFVDGALEIFQAKKSEGDYHGEMNGEHYEEWFTKQLLPFIEPNSVIVIDNAPYHSVKKEIIPTTKTRKADIQAWLTEKGEAWNADMLKPELLQQVRNIRHKYEAYRIDSIAELHGHTVLRLPPYHCELNPIEEVWSEVKRHVATENKTFKLDEVANLVRSAIAGVTAKKWENYVSHAVKEEARMWEADGLTEELVDRLSFNIGASSSEPSSESSSDSLSGIECM